MADSSTTRRPRRRGDGSTYTTTDGRLRATITVPDPLTGRPVRRYLSARTDRELREKLAAARDARDDGRQVGRTPTLATWSDRWLALVATTVLVHAVFFGAGRYGLVAFAAVAALAGAAVGCRAEMPSASPDRAF